MKNVKKYVLKSIGTAVAACLAMAEMMTSMPAMAAQEDFSEPIAWEVPGDADILWCESTEIAPNEAAGVVVYSTEDILSGAISFVTEENTSYTNYSTDYYYNQLTEPVKKWWDAMDIMFDSYLNGTANLTGGYTEALYFPEGVDTDTGVKLMSLYRMSRPQYYFLKAKITYSTTGGYGRYAIYPAFQNGSSRRTCTNQFFKKIDTWSATYRSFATTGERVKSVHDIICENATYDVGTAANEDTGFSQSAYGIVVNGRGVGFGYSLAATMMLNDAGIPAICVSSTISHQWNMAQVDGIWYVVDAALDDDKETGDIYYDYFGLSTATVEKKDNGHELIDTFKGNPVSIPSAQKDAGSTHTKAGKLGTGGAASDKRGTVNPEDHIHVDREKIEAFVTRLYNVCLDRNPDEGGLKDWTDRLVYGEISGVEAAQGFIFSSEFKAKNFCNTCYTEHLYSAFMGRTADAGGKDYWIGNLESGMTREEVFNGFALSREFEGICEEFGITQGTAIPIPEYGTVPTGACSVDGTVDGVTAFVTRLYNVCLDREPDKSGLADWTGKLWNHEASGSEIAFGFIFSDEFKAKELSDEDFIEYMYKAIFGRNSDAGGKADWLDRMTNQGYSRQDVFEGFTGSQEFDKLCAKYGIKK